MHRFDRYGYPPGFDEFQFYDAREEMSFASSVRDLMEAVGDVIMTDISGRIVDINLFIEILSLEEKEETLELWALRQIKRKGQNEKMEARKLAEQMQKTIKKLQMDQANNINRWWMSFKRAGNGGGKSSFQVKKIKEYAEKIDFGQSSGQQEKVFKNRNYWTYNELLKSSTKV